MPAAADVVAAILIMAGAVFFVAGTVGLLRFPDVYTRLHALSKADNLGLGLIVLGLAVSADRLLDVVHLALIWLLVLLASATSAHLIARRALHRGDRPWTPPDR
jgi:multicomponent Na+:H+ antiporter subunit G